MNKLYEHIDTANKFDGLEPPKPEVTQEAQAGFSLEIMKRLNESKKKDESFDKSSHLRPVFLPPA